MARNLGVTIENSFVQGLVTEATGLNFPENACTDTLNCIFDNKGLVKRRLGIDYENDNSTASVTRNDSIISEYVWNSVAGTGTINFVVVQIGDTLHFYNISTSAALSAEKKSFTVDLEARKVSGAPLVKNRACQFASGKGVLFVSHPYLDPFYVDYDPDTDAITNTTISLKIRDMEGVLDETTSYDQRPTGTITVKHKYNIYNQGWYASGSIDIGLNTPSVGFTGNYADGWFAINGFHPSNAEMWWVYKDFRGLCNQSLRDAFSFGNTPAPKGHYILDAFRLDRSAASGIAGLDVVSAGFQRPQCISFYASRVWYAGVDFKGFNTRIYYSQILETLLKVGYCHQHNDPTAEDLSDLLPTDGGIIDIPEIGNIVKMFATQAAIVIFATNGVWAIAGNEGAGFTGTDFTVKKISSIPTLSASSFIDVQGAPVWWNLDGIYTLQVNQTGQFSVVSLTDNTIKTFYNDIPQNNKRYAKGSYNPLTKTIQWLYNSSLKSTTDTSMGYNSILNLNLLTGAFYPWGISTSGTIQINGIVCIQGTGTVLVEDNVTDSLGNIVTTAALANVTVEIGSSIELSSVFKYLTTKNTSGTSYDMTWSEEFDTVYGDWRTPNSNTPVDYSSYFISGYKIRGNALNLGQPNYIVFYMNTVANSSAFLQTIWEYSNSFNSNLESIYNQMYRPIDYRDIQQFREALRGSGRTVQFKIFSETGKPFEVIGWATQESVNATV